MPSKIKLFWEKIEALFPKDSVLRLLLQFFLIVVAGTFISNHFAEIREKENRDLTILKQKLEDRTKFVYEYSKIVNSRLFLMQLVYWELDLHNEINDYRQNQLKMKYNEYYQTLVEWNSFLTYHLISLENHFCNYNQLSDKLFTMNRFNLLPKSKNLRDLTLKVMQKKFGALHKRLKKCKDKRLELNLILAESERSSLKKGYKNLPDITYQYLDLIYQLSTNPETLN